MTKMIKYKLKSNYDEDEPVYQKEQEPHVGCVVKQQISNHYRVFIDKGISEPKEYRNLIQILMEADEHDVVELVISSPGGSVESMTNIITCLENCQAETVAVILGSCHSAASFIALHCKNVYVGKHATMLVHSARYGEFGKQADVRNAVEFYDRVLEKLIRDTYEGFLTPEEFDKVLAGHELYLDSEQIIEKLKNRDEHFETLAQLEEAENQDEDDE